MSYYGTYGKPYGNRPYYGNRYRKRYQKRKQIEPTYGQIGSKMWRDLKYLKSIVNVESKHLEYTANTTSSTTAAFVLINGSVPGDSGESREGQSILLQSVLLRYIVTLHASATATLHRVIVFIDSQPNAAVPGAADILDTATNVLSPINITYGARFKILRDIMRTVDTNNLIVNVNEFIKIERTHTKFNAGTAGTVADISTNSLYVLHMSSEGTNVPVFDYFVRTRFIDN